MSNCSTSQDIDSPFDKLTTIQYSQSCKKKLRYLFTQWLQWKNGCPLNKLEFNNQYAAAEEKKIKMVSIFTEKDEKYNRCGML